MGITLALCEMFQPKYIKYKEIMVYSFYNDVNKEKAKVKYKRCVCNKKYINEKANIMLLYWNSYIVHLWKIIFYEMLQMKVQARQVYHVSQIQQKSY